MFSKLAATTKPHLFSQSQRLMVGSLPPTPCSFRGFSRRSLPASPIPNSPPGNKNPSTTDTPPPNHISEPDYTPPWHRSCIPEPSPERLRYRIVGGIFIPYSEGRSWLQRKHGISLPDNHCRDLAILSKLMNGMRAKGYYDNLELVQSRETDDATLDILVKTKIKVGRFYNTGPPGIEEVVQEDLKNIFKPGRLEKKWIKILSKDFGITATEFKCFFAVDPDDEY